MNHRVIPLLALVFLATTIGLSNILPAHAVPLFTLANKNTTCFNGTGNPCTTPTVSLNLGVPNGAAPFFNITVTASAADSVTFSSTSNATGPIVSFKDNPLVFSGAGAINETVTIAAPATGFHGGYSVVITGTDSGGTASITYLVKIYTISIRIDAASTGPTDATATLTGSNGKTFVVSAIVNASTSGGRCAVAFPCSFPLYGWQIGFNYDPTKLIAQGDPCGTVCPTGTVPDGALPTIIYGSQATTGTANWAGFIGPKAFTAQSLSPGHIQFALTMVSPSPQQVLTALTQLAGVSFELLDTTTATPFTTSVVLDSTVIKFVDTNANPACSCPIAVGGGFGGTATETITNHPPVASFTVTHLTAGDAACTTALPTPYASPCSGYAFTYDASGSTDDVGVTSYSWNFGDGILDLNDASGSVVTVDYQQDAAAVPGVFIVTLHVADVSGATGAAVDSTGVPTVNNQPSHATASVQADIAPTAAFTFTPSSPTPSTPVNFDASTSTDPDDAIAKYFWTFGDGTGEADTVATTSHTYSSCSLSSCNEIVTLIVQDAAGVNSTAFTQTVVVSGVIAGFTITADPVSPAQILGSASGTSTITLAATNGFTGTVNLSVSSSSPAGLTCSALSSVIFGASPQTRTLSCSATANGDYTVTVTGTSGSLTHTTANIVFHVVDFSISAGSVAPAQILAGGSGSSTITVTALNGLTGTVSFTVSTSTPAGLTCTPPSSVTFGTSPMTSTLSCSATLANDYTVTVTGADGALSHTTASIVFHVTDYTIAPSSPVTVSTTVGVAGTQTITVTAANGFTGTVSFTVSASSPSGLTCPAISSVTFGTSPKTATLSCSASATGDYVVTVTATSGTLSHTTANITFHVTAAPDFSVSAGPVNPTQILAAASGTSTITVNALNSFTGIVSLAVSASTPSGLTCGSLGPVTFGSTPQTATLSCSATAAGDYTVTVTGTSSTAGPHSTGNILFHVTDFSIAPSSPVTVSTTIGVSGTQTITLTALNGFTGTVSFTISPSSPSGLTCTPLSSVTFGSTPQSASLSCSASTTGDFVVTITGNSGTLSHITANITFHVATVPLGFSISAGPVSPSQILAGASGTSTIAVTALNGFTGTVNFSVSASSPSGLTCTTPTSVTFGSSPMTSTLSCSATTAGDYTVTVTGTSGTLSHDTASILFHVVDFTIAPSSPVTVSGTSGSSITQTITVTAVNSFTGTVNLSFSPSSPSGLTCTLPASVTFGSSSQTATLSCSATVTSDTDFTVTVTGTSGTLSHSTAAITFHVTAVAAPDFSISAGPVSPSQILLGGSGDSIITVTALNGYTGTVNFNASPQFPNGVTCSNPSPITFGSSPQTFTLTCTSSGVGDTSVRFEARDSVNTNLVHITSIVFHVVDFAISPDTPVTVSGNSGSPITQTITIDALNGLTGTINLSASASTPAGLTCNIAPSVTFGSTPQTATLSCTATVTSATDFTETVTGTIGTLTHTTAAITFHVNPPAAFDYSLSASPTSGTVAQGSTTTTTITATLVTGTGQDVTFSASGLPSGVTANFSPTHCTPTCSTTLTFTASSSATTGQFTVTITGTASGGLQRTTSYALTVTQVTVTGDFTVGVNPAHVNITAGSSRTVTVVVHSINNFAGDVTLTVFISPSVSNGPTASFSTTTVTLTPNGTGTSKLTLSTTTSTPAGTYTVTVTGTSGALSHSDTTSLVVKTKTKGALTLSFRGSDLDDFDKGVGQLQVLVNGQLVADVPAGVNNLSGSGDFAPYAETSVNFGPFDITNFTVDGQNTIMFQSPPPGHYGEVKRISITQDGALILSVRDTQAVSLSQSASFTFSLPALVITSLSASGNNPSTGEPVTFTASYQGGTDPISCSFKFGDGQSSSTAGSAGTCSATHAYDNEDTFGVTVLVKGASTSDKAQSRLHLTVQNGDSQDPAPNVDQSSTGSQAPSSDSDQDDD